jgi:3',5'-cyclic AMP phosphodiesterase CpdA
MTRRIPLATLCTAIIVATLGLALAQSPPAQPGSPVKPAVAKWTPRPLPTDQVNLLAMGDWGANTKEQKLVAQALARYADKSETQFNGLVSVGDNFYVKLSGPDDYQFQSLFEDMYDASRINFPFFIALGNHDYQHNKARIQLAYAHKHPDSRWKLPNRWYRMDFPAEKPLVMLLVLDSNKPNMSREDWDRQIRWMEYHLAAPRESKWVVAAAHHPLFSNGSHGDNGVLQTQWGPLFKKHKLDFYVCGHDHDVQHLQLAGWHPSFLITGGGGKRPTKMRRDSRGPFSRSLNGFAHLHFTPQAATVKFTNANDGKLLHHFTRTTTADIKVHMTTGRDKATNKPLLVLLGLDQKEIEEEKEPSK